MDQTSLMKELHLKTDSKIVLVVLDGLGGAPLSPDGPTELEAAATPNLDALAKISEQGLSTPVSPGVTPGSGPGHLALFGYDPLSCQIGRGVLEALGIGFELTPRDVAARGNFCTVDPASGLITDRRAGRIPTQKCRELVDKLGSITLPGVEIFIEPVKDYRFVLVLRGEDLADGLTETDPQVTGQPPLPVKPTRPEAEKTAALFNQWLAQARKIIRDERPANSMNLRGLAMQPDLPCFAELYGLRAAAIATYPMYRGVARLVGMQVIEAGDSIETEVQALKKHWNDFDFFFFHVKKTDSMGEDGNFEGKTGVIEEFDRLLPRIMELTPDVTVITGDHSTPAALKSHSWHPLPVLIKSAYSRPEGLERFGERMAARGGLGHIRHTHIMPLAMAHALKLGKYGA